MQCFRVIALVDSEYCLILFGKDVKGGYTPWNLVKILVLNVTLPIQTNLNKTFIKSILTIIVIKMNDESFLKAERFMLIRSYVCFGFKNLESQPPWKMVV